MILKFIHMKPQKESMFTGNGNPFLKEKTNLWSAYSTDGAEIEVGEFIYGLIRLIKPKIIVETGCYFGDTTEQIVKALKDNKFGKLYTCDIVDKCLEETEKKVGKSKYVEIKKMAGIDLIKEIGDDIEFAFIDSGYTARDEEIDELVGHLSENQMFALHDTAPQHAKMRELSNRVAAKYNLRSIYLNSPRGLTIYEKQIKEYN